MTGSVAVDMLTATVSSDESAILVPLAMWKSGGMDGVTGVRRCASFQHTRALIQPILVDGALRGNCNPQYLVTCTIVLLCVSQ